jgi:multidrug efflux pump subunit AcrA (membrane-fusion protein)
MGFPKDRRIIFSYLTAGIFLLGVVCGCGKQEARVAAQGPDRIPVKVIKVKIQDMEKTLDYVGDIKSKEEVIVYSKVTGKIIQKVKEEGAAVKKGDVLAYVDRDEVGLTFQKAPVESPIAGTVGRMNVDLGTRVFLEMTPVALVVNMDDMKIDIRLPEKYTPKVVLGQDAQVAVDAYPEQEFHGAVTKIAPVLDLETRSALIEISVPNPGHLLKSGMFAKVRLTIEKQLKIPVILKEAILGRGADMFVFLVEDDKAVQQKVKVSMAQGPYMGISEGLKEGDRVVIMGQQKLTQGALVNPEEAE